MLNYTAQPLSNLTQFKFRQCLQVNKLCEQPCNTILQTRPPQNLADRSILKSDIEHADDNYRGRLRLSVERRNGKFCKFDDVCHEGAFYKCAALLSLSLCVKV